MEIDLSGATDVDRGETVAALAHQQRRRVLGILQAADAPLGLADLAVELARRDDEEDVWERAEHHRLKLYHRHVPKLEDVGLVEFDEERRAVSLSPAAPEAAIDEEVVAQMEA